MVAEQRMNHLNSQITSIAKRMNKENSDDLELKKRIVKRLDSFAPECEICEVLLSDIEKETMLIMENRIHSRPRI
jgi:hypothetical protein